MISSFLTYGLGSERAEYIDRVVDKLKEQYGASPDWQIFAKDHNVNYVEDDRVIIPFFYFDSNNPRKVYSMSVYVPKKGLLLESNKAHEWGHFILEHRVAGLTLLQEEAEANYFASRITGEDHSILETLLDQLPRIIQQPFYFGLALLNMDRYGFRLMKDVHPAEPRISGHNIK